MGGTGGMGGGDIVIRMAEADVLVLSKPRGPIEKPLGGGIGGGTGGFGGGGDKGPFGKKPLRSSHFGETRPVTLRELSERDDDVS